jgi:hypothetical protein
MRGSVRGRAGRTDPPQSVVLSVRLESEWWRISFPSGEHGAADQKRAGRGQKHPTPAHGPAEHPVKPAGQGGLPGMQALTRNLTEAPGRVVQQLGEHGD